MSDWKRLADEKPAGGQLVEYRGVNPECARKEYRAIGLVPRKGYFVKDCGAHWTENLGGFTTERPGVIIAPDPEITFWRAVIDPKVIHGSPDTGIAFLKPQQFNYCFIQEGKEVGKIWWDEELHRLRFQGQVDETVWVLMKELQRQFDAWYEEKYG